MPASSPAQLAGQARHDRALKLLNRLLLVTSVVTFIGLGIRFHRLDRPCEWDDVYLRAARALAAGTDVYGSVPLYTYPPFMAWAAIPFTWLPTWVRRALWFAINVACFLAMIRMAWLLVYPEQPAATANSTESWRRWAVFAFGLFLGGRAMTNSMLHHQTDLVLGTLVFCGIVQHMQGRHFRAAVALGLAAAMKCTPLLWILVFLWSGPRRAALVLLLTALLANLLPNVTHPPSHGTWLSDWMHRVLFQTLRPEAYPGQWNVDVMTNQSLAGSVYAWTKSTWTWNADGVQIAFRSIPLLSPLQAKMAVYGVGMALLWASFWRFPRPRWNSVEAGQTTATHAAMVLLLMLLLSPMSHKTHFGLLLIPAFALGRAWFDRRSRGLTAVLVLVLILQIGSLRAVSVPLGYLASWFGAQMLTTLFLLIGCWLVLNDKLSADRDNLPAMPWPLCQDIRQVA